MIASDSNGNSLPKAAMHERNPYRDVIDFRRLAFAYPDLEQHLVGTVHVNAPTIDFKNEFALRSLTRAILHCDFGLDVILPQDRLCPPVPNRLNYILWLQDIVDAQCWHESTVERRVRGVDIGTGASAIYPLLGCALEPRWSFLATELDNTSYTYALQNITQNSTVIQNRVDIIKVASPEDPIFKPLVERQNETYDFTMCNPPFYSSQEEVLQSAQAKEQTPNAVCTGAPIEMITTGGEAEFVQRMVEESEDLRDRCRWFTSMLGKLSSVTSVVDALRAKHIDNYAITELTQGQTRRWVVGWSFTDLRLPDELSRISNPALQRIMPSRNVLFSPFFQIPSPHTSISVPKTTNDTTTSATAAGVTLILPIIEQAFHDIDELTVKVLRNGNLSADANDSEERGRKSDNMYIIAAEKDTWSRTARRRRKRAPEGPLTQISTSASASASAMDTSSEGGITRKGVTCGVSVRWKGDSTATAGGEEWRLEFRWLAGKNRTLFESLVSHISRKVSTGV